MRPIRWLPWVLVFAIGAAVAAQPEEEPDPAKIAFETTRVAPNVYMLTASGGNVVASVSNEGIVLVDSDYAEAHANLLAAIRRLAGDGPVRYVIETHYHLDHSGGAGLFVAEGVTLIAHDKVAARLATGAKVRVGPFTQVIEPVPAARLPTLAFDSRLSLVVDDEVISAVHFPAAHTDGDSVIFFKKANIVHMGDVFVRYGFPFIDVPAGGRIDGAISACDAVIAATNDEVRIIPGHGAVATRADLIEFRNMLKGARAAVERSIAAGMTLDQIKSHRVLAPWSRYSNIYVSAEFFIETIYRSLTAAADQPGSRGGEIQ